MKKNTRFRSFAENEKKKLEKMTWRQRGSYILDYYWLWILGTACAIFLLGYVTYRVCFTVKDYWLYAMFANTMEDGGNGSPLWKDFTEYGGYDLTAGKVEMNAASYFDPSVSGGTNNNYYQAFVALVESGALDLVVMGEEGLKRIGSSGRLRDLGSEDCRILKEKYGDRLVYCIPEDEEYSTGEVPVGIDLSDSLLVTRYHLYPDDCVLGVCAYTKHLEAVGRFLEFIIG